MKRTELILACWFSVSVLAIGGTKTNITTASGIVYSNVVVSRADKEGLVLVGSNGIQHISFEELPEDLQRQYAEDKQKALVAEKQKQVAETNKVNDALDQAQRSYIWGKVTQVLDDGILLRARILTYAEYLKVQKLNQEIRECEKNIAQKQRQLEDTRKDIEKKPDYRYSAGKSQHEKILDDLQEPINSLAMKRDKLTEQLWAILDFEKDTYVVSGIAASLVDGDVWWGSVYYAGRYQYVSVLNVKKTVRHYAVSKELADTILSGPESTNKVLSATESTNKLPSTAESK